MLTSKYDSNGHMVSNPLHSRLVDTLEEFLDKNSLPAVKDFHDEFPKTITLAQSVAVWKHIIWYKKELGTHKQ